MWITHTYNEQAFERVCEFMMNEIAFPFQKGLKKINQASKRKDALPRHTHSMSHHCTHHCTHHRFLYYLNATSLLPTMNTPPPFTAFLTPSTFPLSHSRSSSHRSLTCHLSYTNLGPVDNVSTIALGTWAWGNKLLYSYSRTDAYDASLEQLFTTALSRGISLFDTADSYGIGPTLNGRAETLLGQFCSRHASLSRNARIATKLAPYPCRLSPSSFVDAAEASCIRLRRVPDILQVHWPVNNYFPLQQRPVLDGFADAYRSGYCRSVGLSNYGPRVYASVKKYMDERHADVPLSTVQTQLSLLYPRGGGGVAEAAQRDGLGVIGYSPLCLGLLAGNGRSQSSVARAALYDYVNPQRVVQQLRMVASMKSENGGEIVTPAQVAIAWCIRQGVVVLSGARNSEQLLDVLQACRVELTDDEAADLERAAGECRGMIDNAFLTK